MRTYHVFVIKNSLMDYYGERPYSLYKILEQIYNLKTNDIVLGYKLLNQVTNSLDTKRIDKYIYKNNFDENTYKRIYDGHIISNKYTDEETFLHVYNSHIRIKTNNNYSVFFESIKNYNNNMFVCDFENQDYFWLNKIKVESIV